MTNAFHTAKEIAQAHKDFTRADDLSKAFAPSEGSGGSGSGTQNNDAANWRKSKK